MNKILILLLVIGYNKNTLSSIRALNIAATGMTSQEENVSNSLILVHIPLSLKKIERSLKI